jgi:hypothetical protein
MDELLANLANTASDSSVPGSYVSNAYILEDDFRLSWYNILLYELLERLPRQVVVHYVRLYFEATMKALATVARHDWTPSSEGLISLVKGGKMLKGGKGRFASSDPLPYADINQEKEKGKKKKKRS